MRAIRAVTLLLLTGTAALCWAQSGGQYEIRKSTIDGGGGHSSGGAIDLRGTIGQPDASLQTATGGSFSLTGGFWAAGEIAPPVGRIFSDGFES
jgi:hypothetical protein